MKTIIKAMSILAITAYSFASHAGVTKIEFDSVLDKIHALYKDRVEEQGRIFTVNKKWEDNTINAYAQYWPDRFIITVLGGIARHERTTPDALAIIACHEVGFLFGGAPKHTSQPGAWASVIGQADYYATTKCMKKYLADEDNIAFLADKEVPEVVSTKCATAYPGDAAGQALCARSTLGSIQLAKLLGDLTGNEVNIDTPSTEVAEQTNTRFPGVQCRLDNFFAGALCNVNADDDTLCAQGTLGGRPQCWYKESEGN